MHVKNLPLMLEGLVIKHKCPRGHRNIYLSAGQNKM